VKRDSSALGHYTVKFGRYPNFRVHKRIILKMDIKKIAGKSRLGLPGSE